MTRIALIHQSLGQSLDDAASLAETLRHHGFEVDHLPQPAPAILSSLRRSPPDAVIIDLSRLPSHGREIAIALRGNRHTRNIPILFLDGAPDKVAVVREKLPDAAYCDRSLLPEALRKCIRDAPANPVVPAQMMDRYAARTTAQKLGIAAGSKVAVIDAPRDYARVIGPLPDRVEFDEESWQGCAVTVWFVEQPGVLLAALPNLRRAAAASRLWIVWPKKAARKGSPLSETLVRDAALAGGLVDFKVCSLNPTWSGLCFALKKAPKKAGRAHIS